MSQTQEEKRTHLREYWRLVQQSRWTVLSISAVVFTLVAVATFMQTEIYRATSAVEIQPRAKSISPNADFSQIGVSTYNWSAEEKYINTQMEVLRSRTTAHATLENLGFLDAPQFAQAKNPADALVRRMTLRVLPETYIVELSVDDPDPLTAQMLANGVAETYITMNVEEAKKSSREVINELTKQIDPITQQISEKETARLQLFQRENYYASEAQGQSIEKRITQLETELTTLRIRLGERESVLKAIDEIEKRDGSLESLPIVANDSIVIGLKEEAYALEQQMDKLSASKRAGHPEVVAARVALAEIPRKIAAEAARIVTKARTEYAVDKRRELDLQDQLRRTREEGLGLSNTQSELATLESEIRELRRIYELVNTRIKEIDLNQQTVINNLQMHERASLPEYPVRPRKLLNLAAGLILGLFLGIGSAFFIDYLDNTIRDSEDIERFLELPLLAMVPKTDDVGSTAVREAMQTLRTSVLFGSKGRSLKTILVTSAGPSEGKSRTAVNLAKTLAGGGERAILIDADLRRPTVHKQTSLVRDGGLTNYMMGREGGDSWRRWVKSGGAENLDVLTCGPLPPKPVELFGSDRFTDFIEQVKREYTWVIIDSPPVASLADTLVLATLAEMTIFVIQHKKNDRELIKRSIEQLRNVDANMLGAVLNAVDLKRVGYGDYYYASYTYTQDPESESDEPARSGTENG